MVIGKADDQGLRQVRQVGFQLVGFAESRNLMQAIGVGVVLEFDVKVVKVIQQENVLAFVAVGKNVARKVKGIELLVGGQAGKIGRLHSCTGLTGEINKKRAAHQMSRPTLYSTRKTPLQYN